MTKTIKAVILGASGYTGVELARLLWQHPHVEIAALVANSNAGQAADVLYPHLKNTGFPPLITMDEVDFLTVDVVFCCLPHATTQEVVPALLDKGVVVIDLSADFRIRDPKVYEEWYGKVHSAVEQQKQAVYGLSEHYRDEVKEANLIACPGCYPTSILLPILPLLKNKLIKHDDIMIDSKSGMTGAGRSAKQANLFTEINESIKPYGVAAGHRHMAEIEQEFMVASGEELKISFTPQVVPMNRGILSCIYASLEEGVSASDVSDLLQDSYKNEPFVHVIDREPSTREVMGSNQCRVAVFANRLSGKITILSVIDNLLKGASGQAVQNMNIRFDLPEVTGLEQLTIFP